MRRLVTFHLVLTLGGCGLGGAAVEGSAEVADEATTDDLLLLLGDARHLLGEAVAAHGAGDLALAERRWQAAVAIWRDRLAPELRKTDAVEALAVEYAIGRLGDALRRSRSRPGPAFQALDRDLAALRPRLASSRDPEGGS